MDKIEVHEGSTRRDLLRRSAVVGGALVWTVPVVQSMASAASAAAGSPRPVGSGDRRSARLSLRFPNADNPALQLENDSDTGIEVTSFRLTIGDTSFNFDTVTVQQVVGPVTAALISPDTRQNFVRSNLLAFTFTGFRPGSMFGFSCRVELDANGVPNAGNNVNFRTVLFNNGAAPDAVATFGFNEGPPLSVTLSGPTNRTTYTWAVQDVV